MEKRVMRILPVKLTNREVIERGQLAAQVLEKIDEIESSKKAHAQVCKERSEKLEAELRRLSFIVKREEEDRIVECVWKFDFMKNEKNLVRLDTAEVVETKPMTDEERQIALEIEEQDNENDTVVEEPDSATAERS